MTLISSIAALSISDKDKLSLNKLGEIKAKSNALKQMFEKAESYKLKNKDKQSSNIAFNTVKDVSIENITNNLVLNDNKDINTLTTAEKKKYVELAKKEFKLNMKNEDFRKQFQERVNQEYNKNYADVLKKKLIEQLDKPNANLLNTQMKLNNLIEKINKLYEDNGKAINKTHQEQAALEHFHAITQEYIKQYEAFLTDAQYDKDDKIEVESNGKIVKKTRTELMNSMLEELSISKLYKAFVDNNKELGRLNLEGKTLQNKINAIETVMFGKTKIDIETQEGLAELEKEIDIEIAKRKLYNEELRKKEPNIPY